MIFGESVVKIQKEIFIPFIHSIIFTIQYIIKMPRLDILAFINLVTERSDAFTSGDAHLRGYHCDHFSVYDAATDKLVNVTKEGVCEQCKDQSAVGKCTDNNIACRNLIVAMKEELTDVPTEECQICTKGPAVCDHAKCTHPILHVPAIVADLGGFTGILNLNCPY